MGGYSSQSSEIRIGISGCSGYSGYSGHSGFAKDEITHAYISLVDATSRGFAKHLDVIEKAIIEPVTRTILRGSNRYIEYDDALQLARVAILKALPTYDATRSAAPFLNIVVRSALLAAIKARRRPKNGGNIHHTSLSEMPDGSDAPFSAITADYRTSEFGYENKELAETIWQKLTNVLSAHELAVLWGTISCSQSWRTLARKFGCNAKKIDNTLQRIRLKLELFQRGCRTDYEIFTRLKKAAGTSPRKASSIHRGVCWCSTKHRWIAKYDGSHLGHYLTELDALAAIVRAQHGDFAISPKRQKRGTSKQKGVCFDKRKQRWRAQEKINGTTKCYGLFKTEIGAIEAYRKAKGLCD